MNFVSLPSSQQQMAKEDKKQKTLPKTELKKKTLWVEPFFAINCLCILTINDGGTCDLLRGRLHVLHVLRVHRVRHYGGLHGIQNEEKVPT
jgi:hypothetical protein